MKAPGSEQLNAEAIPDDRKASRGYLFAAAAILIAFLIRLSLDSFLKDKFPNATIVLATVLVAWYGGFYPSVLTAALGFLLCNWFFISPRHSFQLSPVDSSNHVYGNLAYLFVTGSIIWFGWSMHLARRRADANARQAIGHLKHLKEEVVERKRIEEEVRRLNEELEARVAQRTADLVVVNQDLESFTYSVSHDLRAPLRHIHGYTQLLEEEFAAKLPDGARDYAEKIRRSSQNMVQLVDDLLNLSQVGKKVINREPVALNRLVDEAVVEIKPEAGDRRIEWEIQELPPAECDPRFIKQVFLNLLSNAVKYTRPQEHACIEIGHLNVDGESAIYVRDNGVGFDMKYSGKLFGAFQRLHRAEEFEGTGVGLATVARIIRKHGGRIWAEAEVNKGATFFFTLEPPGRKVPAAVNGKVAAQPASSSKIA
jgi:signal transduction histidine kinase